MKVPEPRKMTSGNWFIQLRLNGQSLTVTAPTKKEAIRQAELVKAEHRNGKRFAKTEKGELTIKELMLKYVDSRKKVLSPSSLRGYNTIIENRFANYRDKKPSTIKDWQKVINDEIASGVSAKTIKNSWSLLAASFDYNGTTPPSVKLPVVQSSVRPWLDADQINLFIKAISGEECEIAALLALHSLRRSEIVGLTWDKIDLEKDTIRIEGAAVFNSDNSLVFKATNKSKNSRRVVPVMIPRLHNVLASVPEDARQGRVVTMNPNTIWSQINRVCRAASLPEVGVHGLRHSFASLAHHVGLPEQEAMLIGGWEDAQTMHKIYEHISAADKLKSENKMKEFYQKSSFQAVNAN